MPEDISGEFPKLFSEMMGREDEDISLAEATLCVAGLEYPALDVSHYVGILDSLAHGADQHIGAKDDRKYALNRLSEYLFIREGFAGNHANYYDPENSYLNRVLERKLGIPITLSLVYMEVAQRIGLVLEGIGLPGHFILRHGPPDWELYVDPFNEGRLLDKAECEQVVGEMFHGTIQLDERSLAPLSKKRILVRVLTNLKGIYHDLGEFRKSIAVADHIDIVEPGMASNLKDRAWFHYQSRSYRPAIKDLERYLGTTPQPADADHIKRQIRTLWSELASLN